ncbi:hypothetical protein [Pseudoramibacter faecis]|nr:hypothetical protein [Pseudoramibacter sp. HA2172]
MDNFSFYAPTYFEFGKDTENSEGRGGSISGFVTLDEEACTRIYQLMV